MDNPPANAGDLKTPGFNSWVGKIPQEEGMAAASSIPWTEGPGGLQPRGSQRLKRQKHTAQYNVSFPSPFFPMLSLKRPFLFHGIFFNFFFFYSGLYSTQFSNRLLFFLQVTFAGKLLFLVMQPHLLVTSRHSFRVH